MNPLFHYTKLECFKSMLEGSALPSGDPCITFWATSAYNMDDQTEMNFGYPLIYSVLKGIESSSKLTHEQRLSSIIASLQQFITGPNDQLFLPKTRTPFVISFSRACDSDYMWSHFGNVRMGVCLMFDSEEIFRLTNQKENTFLFDIAYIDKENIDYKIWEALVNEIVFESQRCELLMPILKNKADISRYKKYILDQICPVISAAIKDGIFSKEQEVRWISVRDESLASIRKCEEKTKKYIEIKFPLTCLKGISYSSDSGIKKELESICNEHNLILTPSFVKYA